ncbi:hypothetical protein, partial [Paraburkholderia sp. SIMBA_053]|uniref:hypothetical protein n=1 Tax=Paraburkholderia sp. SIMBA_053 TaxID=3085794 RepID=UPI00397B2ED4
GRTRAAITSDSIGYFEPVRIALQTAGARANLPLFDLFMTDQQHFGQPKGDHTHFETKCPICSVKVAWPAQLWRDVKDRPYTCRNK